MVRRGTGLPPAACIPWGMGGLTTDSATTEHLSTDHLRAFSELKALQTPERKMTRQCFPNLFILEPIFSPVGHFLWGVCHREYTLGIADAEKGTF